MIPQAVPLNIYGGGTIAIEVQSGESVPLKMEQVRTIYADERTAYDGPYTVTPGMEAQSLQTNGKRMTANVVVNAIPQNYGLVTWNGAWLTIS